ncbi:MAG: SPOR domain-containing protein [bacterium]|jgi:DedD protein|nr:SPOR domain-containing protein [Betaproteobacteria bacterium]
MARSTSDEETKLRKRARRRLIGAIALTTLVVVTLPMVLDSEPRPLGDDIAVQIPSPNSGPYAPKGQVDAAARPAAPAPPAKASGTVGSAPPAATDAAAAPASARPAAPAPSSATPADQKIELAGAARPAPDAVAPSAAMAADARAAADKAAEARAAAARAAEAKAAETKAVEARSVDPKDAEAKNFVIQLGAFSEVNRAKDRHAQLVKAGIKSYTEVIKTPTGDKTRVRAGPFPTRQAAEQANERVKALGMTDGIVVPRRY